MTSSDKRDSKGASAPATGTLYLYSGAGNTFVVLDGRSGFPTDSVDIVGLCAKYSTDGLMILRDGNYYNGASTAPDGRGDTRPGYSGTAYDFAMEFFNPDASGGMMCGNGGRCIVAFADYLGLRPADGKVYRFVAGDGEHTGEILSVTPDSSVSPYMTEGLPTHHLPAADGVVKTVRIKMIDVREFHPALDGWFVNTGTRHFVKFVADVENLDIEAEGKRYRWDPEFAPVGANANFVKFSTPDAPGTCLSQSPDQARLVVRTFEKGVEGETLACGTGITASAIAAWLSGVVPTSSPETESTCARKSAESEGKVSYEIRAREDDLRVDFRPIFRLDPGDAPNPTATATGEAPSTPLRVDRFEDVYLTGPAKLYCIID